MTATLTPAAYTLRCGPHHTSYGDPYTIAAHVQRIGKDGAHIVAAFAWQEAEESRLAATPDEELSEFVISPAEES